MNFSLAIENCISVEISFLIIFSQCQILHHFFFECIQEFFLNVKDLLRQSQNDEKPDNVFQLWTTAANDLQRKFNDVKTSIHLALCDNIDTRTVLDRIRDLIGHCNVYIRDHKANGTPNHLLLKRIAVYITKILRIFGVIHDARDDIGFPLDAGKSTNVRFYNISYLVYNVHLHSCTKTEMISSFYVLFGISFIFFFGMLQISYRLKKQ